VVIWVTMEEVKHHMVVVGLQVDTEARQSKVVVEGDQAIVV